MFCLLNVFCAFNLCLWSQVLDNFLWYLSYEMGTCLVQCINDFIMENVLVCWKLEWEVMQCSLYCTSPLDIARKLNVHRTFNLCPVSRGVDDNIFSDFTQRTTETSFPDDFSAEYVVQFSSLHSASSFVFNFNFIFHLLNYLFIHLF